MQWNVFKGVYFYWEKSTTQFKIELISGEYFLPCGSKFFPGKYYSGSTFFPGNYYSGSKFFRGVIIYGYTGDYFCLVEVFGLLIGNIQGSFNHPTTLFKDFYIVLIRKKLCNNFCNFIKKENLVHSDSLMLNHL